MDIDYDILYIFKCFIKTIDYVCNNNKIYNSDIIQTENLNCDIETGIIQNENYTSTYYFTQYISNIIIQK